MIGAVSLSEVQRSSCGRMGFTLIELLVVLVILLVLAGLLLPAIAYVRRRSNERMALHTVTELVSAINAYRDEDQRHRYPGENADQSISLRAIPGPGPGLLEVLDQRALWSPGSAVKDDDSRLLDPFGSHYRYSLVRPMPASPSGALADWNWDPAAGHERLWGRRPQPDGSVADGPEAFAYIWSLGHAAIETDASTWLYVKDGR